MAQRTTLATIALRHNLAESDDSVGVSIYYWSDLGFDRVGDSSVADIRSCVHRFVEFASAASLASFVLDLEVRSQFSPMFEGCDPSSTFSQVAEALCILIESTLEDGDRKFLHRCLYHASSPSRKGLTQGSQEFLKTLPAVQAFELFASPEFLKLSRVGDWALQVMTEFAPLVLNGAVADRREGIAQYLRSGLAREALSSAGADYLVRRAAAKWFRYGCDLYRTEEALVGYLRRRVIDSALEYLDEEIDPTAPIPIPQDLLESFLEEGEDLSESAKTQPVEAEGAMAELFLLEAAAMFGVFCSAVLSIRSRTNRRTYQGHLALFADEQSENESQSATIIARYGGMLVKKEDSNDDKKEATDSDEGQNSASDSDKEIFFPTLANTARNQIHRASEKLADYWTTPVPEFVEVNKRNRQEGVEPIAETREEHAWVMGRCLYKEDHERFYLALSPDLGDRMTFRELVESS